MRLSTRLLAVLTACIGLSSVSQAANPYYRIGVHYYPGWYKENPTDPYGDANYDPAKNLPYSKTYPWLYISNYNKTGYPQQHNDVRRPLSSYLQAPATYPSDPDNINNPYFYDSGNENTMATQVAKMAQKGINFVMFNWFWNFDKNSTPSKFGTYLNQSVRAFQKASSNNKIPADFQYALTWDNTAGVTFNARNSSNVIVNQNTLADFDSAISYLCSNNFKDANYLKLASPVPGASQTTLLPVLYIFSPEKLRDVASDNGLTGKQLVDRINQAARGSQVPACANGLYLATSFSPDARNATNTYWLTWAADAGFYAIAQYNYHNGGANWNTASGHVFSHDYADLTSGYDRDWATIAYQLKTGIGSDAANRKKYLKFFVPMTAGWNHAPWNSRNGTLTYTPNDPAYSPSDTADPNPPHDYSQPAAVADFTAHLTSARDFIRNNRSVTAGDNLGPTSVNVGIVCCWNEFGEGPVVEPTSAHGENYVDSIYSVFYTAPNGDATKR